MPIKRRDAEASAAAINYIGGGVSRSFWRQLMLLASRDTMIKQFTFYRIGATAPDVAIPFIFLEGLRNFKCRRMSRIDERSRHYLTNDGGTGNSNKSHSP